MKITKDEIIDYKNIAGHMVLSCAANYPAVSAEIRDKGEAEVLMTVNGKEIDIPAFIDHWQSQIDESIAKEAMALVEERFETVRGKMDEVSETLDGVIGNLLSNSPNDRERSDTDN